jgi:hypothetical protein
VAIDDFPEGGVVPVFRVIAEELCVGLCLHLTIKQPREGKSDKEFGEWRRREWSGAGRWREVLDAKSQRRKEPQQWREECVAS